MKFTNAAFVSLAIAASSHALFTPRDEDAHCPGAKVVATSTISASNGQVVEVTTFSCDASLRHLAFTPGNGETPVFPTPPSPTTPGGAPIVPVGSSPSPVESSVPASSPSSAAPPPVADVCAENCSNVCANSGSLPPVTEDCDTIVDAITILNGSVAPTFEVDLDHQQTLTFGTCSFFFQNLGANPLSYCWLSLAQVASAASAACLPPVQPVNSEGFCAAKDGLWRVGVAHA